MSEIANWYSGKTVVVTGCATGIGAALAKLLVDAGAKLIALDYREPALTGIDYRSLDLRDASAIESAAAAIPGPVDALFNCAGVAAEMGFEPLDVMRVNFFGLRALTEALLPKIASGGSITSIASFAGRNWRKEMPQIDELLATEGFAGAEAWVASNPHHIDQFINQAYNLSKESVIVWTMREAAKTITKGVRMNATSPGPVRTALMDAIDPTLPPGMMEKVSGPLGRYSVSEEQAVALFFLGSGAVAAVNGVVLPVDGGLEGVMAAALA